MTTPIETLNRPLIKSAPLVDATSSSNQYVGRVAVASGDSTVTVSTQVVNSDSIIMLSYQTMVASHQSLAVSVSTISPGNFVTFALSGATLTSDMTIMFEIKRAS